MESTGRPYLDLVNEPSLEKLRALLASYDDDAGHHIIWVDRSGKAFIDRLPDNLTPVGWEMKMGDIVKFRLETCQVGKNWGIGGSWGIGGQVLNYQ